MSNKNSIRYTKIIVDCSVTEVYNYTLWTSTAHSMQPVMYNDTNYLVI